jgi:hypothetical protein
VAKPSLSLSELKGSDLMKGLGLKVESELRGKMLKLILDEYPVVPSSYNLRAAS